jgi:hypothetical protein
MPTANDVLAHSLSFSQTIMHRYIDDLQPQEYLHRATPSGNCVAWLIGHLTMTDRAALKNIGVSDLPPLPDGFEKRFSRDAGCPQANEFGDVIGLLPLFDKHRKLLIDAVKLASADLLDKPLEKPHPLFGKVGEFCNFVALHATMHAGQITMLRRSLGKPPLF